jgi:elongation factor P
MKSIRNSDGHIVAAAQPVHQQQDNIFKSATLNKGLEVLMPQFIKGGEIVRMEVAAGKHVDRARADTKWP